MAKKEQTGGKEDLPPAASSKGESSEVWSSTGSSTSSTVTTPASPNLNAAPESLAGQFEQQTFDSQLHQGLRILVPVDVQAYVVDTQTSRVDRPLTKSLTDSIGVHNTGPHSTTNQAPKAQPEGIHLHWSMPDALMIGVEKEGIDPDADLKLKETHEFPALPDRWVVVRQWRENKGSTNWKSKSWLIDSNTKVATDLEQWRSSGPTLSQMTAVDDGNPNTDEDITWTATYDSSHGRFTFHDLPEPGVRGPLNYMVAGWFSTPSQDPLHCNSNQTRGEWKDVMEKLGWNIPEDEIITAISRTQSESGSTNQNQGGK